MYIVALGYRICLYAHAHTVQIWGWGCVDTSLLASVSMEGSALDLETELQKCREERDGYKAEFQALLRRVSRLERYLSRPHPPFRFSLPNYAHYKRHGLKWYSPAFYSHPLGYHFCVEVNANGAGSADCTHVSLFLHVLPGPFDDELTWPFRGSAVIQLLNTKREGGHYEKTIGRNASDKRAADGR